MNVPVFTDPGNLMSQPNSSWASSLLLLNHPLFTLHMLGLRLLFFLSASRLEEKAERSSPVKGLRETVLGRTQEKSSKEPQSPNHVSQSKTVKGTSHKVKAKKYVK